jgi:hypothetical protein
MSGVGITGLIANLPGTLTPYPTQDPALELGGYRSVPDATARDAIPANFRSIGMATTLQDTGVEYKLIGGIANANWTPTQSATQAYIIRATLAALTSEDHAALPNGCQAYVVDQHEIYQLDTANALTTFSPLIVGRGAGAGKWYRRSRAYVVGNFTLWCQSYGPGRGAVGFTPGQLLATATVTPDIVLTLGTQQSGEQTICCDALGNLWQAVNVGSFAGTVARKYLLKDVLSSGAPTPAVTLTPTPTLTESGCCAFDRSGGLWMPTSTHGTFGQAQFVRFGPRAYSQSDGVAGLTITAPASGVPPHTSNTQDMLFDGEGNLWFGIAFTGITPGSGVGGLGMFTAAQLLAGGTQAPLIMGGSNFDGAGGVGNICGLALAPNGLLWAGRYFDASIAAWVINPAASGNPAAAITLTSSLFNGAYSLAFDAAGNLWVNNGNNSQINRIPAASLLVSGAVVPDITITAAPGTTLTSKITFPNNVDRCGLLPSGWPP